MWWMVAAALAAEGAAPAMPAWMTGCWVSQSDDRWTEECWTGPRAGMMMGSGRSGSGETTSDWEVMQIVRTDTDDPAIPPMVFYGSPRGQDRTPFQRVQDGLPGITFANAEHDYPQRIRYWREGEQLIAEVSLMDGSKARRWRYRRPD